MDQKIVIILGAPGAGKGTQAVLLANELNFFHFDTGAYLRSFLFSKGKKDKRTLEMKKFYSEGKLIDSDWLLKILSKKIRELKKLDQSIVFSGSPRTVIEAFGDKKRMGLLPLLEKIYGRKNITIFYIKIPENEIMHRVSHRLVCSSCKTPLLASKMEIKTCPFCGADVEKRIDDRKSIIEKRMEEFREKTLPILKAIKDNKYKVIEIDGNTLPYEIHRALISHIK